MFSWSASHLPLQPLYICKVHLFRKPSLTFHELSPWGSSPTSKQPKLSLGIRLDGLCILFAVLMLWFIHLPVRLPLPHVDYNLLKDKGLYFTFLHIPQLHLPMTKNIYWMPWYGSRCSSRFHLIPTIFSEMRKLRLREDEKTAKVTQLKNGRAMMEIQVPWSPKAFSHKPCCLRPSQHLAWDRCAGTAHCWPSHS